MPVIGVVHGLNVEKLLAAGRKEAGHHGEYIEKHTRNSMNWHHAITVMYLGVGEVEACLLRKTLTDDCHPGPSVSRPVTDPRRTNHHGTVQCAHIHEATKNPAEAYQSQ